MPATCAKACRWESCSHQVRVPGRPLGAWGRGGCQVWGRVLPMGPATEAHTQLQGPLKHAGPHAPLERGFYTTHTRAAAYVLPGDPPQPPTQRPYTHARMHVRAPSFPPPSAAAALQAACLGAIPKRPAWGREGLGCRRRIPPPLGVQQGSRSNSCRSCFAWGPRSNHHTAVLSAKWRYSQNQGVRR